MDFDFGSDDDDDAVYLSIKTNQGTTRNAGRVKEKANLHDKAGSWLRRHEPKNNSDLAVNGEKVNEVRDFLSVSQQTARIAVLTGPAGCGKTATVRAVCDAHHLAVQEWIQPAEVVSYSNGDAVDEEAARRGSSRDDVVPYQSQVKAFKTFMRRIRFNDLKANFGGKGKCVLIDEVPSFARRDPAEFRSALKMYARSSTGFPLVVVISDNSKGSDDLKFLLPPDVMEQLGATHIKFNPVAPTAMVKALEAVARGEADRPGSTKKVPDKETLKLLAEASGGDIRAAINALQFTCTTGLQAPQSLKRCFDSVTTLGSSSSSSSSKRRKAQPAPRQPQPLDIRMATVGGLDSGPNLFHALGKVLYCKRGVKKEEHFLRPGCESRRRLTLLTDPTELLDRLPVAKETFASHLHQNYPPFFSSVEDAAAAAEALSVSDVFFGKFESRGKISLEDYGGEVAVRGVCYANRDVAKQKGMRTFSKTEGYENAKAIRQRSEEIASAFPLYRLRVAATDIVPFVKDLPQTLRDWTQEEKLEEGESDVDCRIEEDSD